MQLALLRPVCACAVLLALARATGRSRRLLQELRAAPSLLVALRVLGYATSGTLTSMALALLPAGVTSLITNTSPLVLVLGGLILFRQRIGAVQIIGTLAGFGGVALLSLHCQWRTCRRRMRQAVRRYKRPMGWRSGRPAQQHISPLRAAARLSAEQKLLRRGHSWP